MLLLLTAFLTPDAQALSCPYGVSNSFPQYGNNEPLPSNFQAAAWTYDTRNSSMDWRIRNENGDYFGVEALELEHDGYEQVFQYKSSDLPADLYTVELEFEYEGLFTFEIEITDTADLEMPAAPVYLNSERRIEEDEWGIWDSLVLSLEAPNETVMYRVETSAEPSFENTKIVHKTAFENNIYIGNDPCDSDHTSQELDEVRHLRITAIDLAGNESSTETFTLNPEPEPEPEPESEPESEVETDPESEENKSGCSSVGQAGVSHLFTILFSVLAMMFIRSRDS